MTDAAERRKTAIVTGAGRGIGRAIAVALARAGYRLCLASRTREELEATRRICGLAARDSLIVLVDLASEDGPSNLIDAAIAHFDSIDVLVNNAGWAPARTTLTRMTDADRDRILALNLRAPIALSSAAARAMIASKRPGAIVNIASAAAHAPAAGEAVYAAAKAGLVSFSHAAFAELREHNIKVCVVVPGLTDTALIPANKRLKRELMLAPSYVATAVMSVVESAARACPVEIAIQPQRDPMRS